MARRHPYFAVVGVACIASVSLLGCGSSGSDHAQHFDPTARSFVVGDASSRFPAETLQDWKSYADAVAVVRVVDERALPPTAEDADHGEGLIGRKVTVEVEKVLWVAPQAPALPERVEMSQPGWVMHDGTRLPLQIAGAPRVGIGDRLLSPFVWVDADSSPEWGPLNLSAELPLVDGKVARPQAVETTPLRTQFIGASVTELADKLAAAQADPAAEKHRDLRPVDRVQAVMEEEAAPGRPTSDP
jgi:hypothetical protein